MRRLALFGRDVVVAAGAVAADREPGGRWIAADERGERAGQWPKSGADRRRVSPVIGSDGE